MTRESHPAGYFAGHPRYGRGSSPGIARLGTVRVRTIEVRILAAALTGLWLAAFGLILVGYRPGGPVDILVGVAAAGPILIAVGALLWPPVARGDRAFALIAWLALGAMLLLIPSLGGLVSQLTGRGPQTLLPSLEAAYPWILALVATGVFAGLGIARRRLGETAMRRRRLALGTVLGLAMVLAAGSLFTTAAIVNELALGDRPAIASRFGPTDPDLEPPLCSGVILYGTTAAVDLRMDSSLDGRFAGQVAIGGIRNGTDTQWIGFAATRLALGQYGITRIGNRSWDLSPGHAWAAAAPGRTLQQDLDRTMLLVALTPANRAVAEDRGTSFIEGARARHCRIAADGTMIRDALPEVELLVGNTDLSRWRGDLDFWVFADGQLGQVDGRISGPALDLSEDALIAGLRFRMTAVDRGLPISVLPPGP
jgi:hypothetical protein